MCVSGVWFVCSVSVRCEGVLCGMSVWCVCVVWYEGVVCVV